MSTVIHHYQHADELAVLEDGEPRTRVKVWDWVVRTTHWGIAFSMIGLSITGIYIGNPYIVVPGPASEHFVMGTMRAIHFYFAIAFTLAVLTRIAWMFMGSRHARWWNFVPVTRERRRGFVGSLRFYLFLDRRPPFFAGHNPVAGAAYTLVFVLYLVIIGTGLGLYAVSAHVDSPFRAFQFLVVLFGGAQLSRWIHHVVMWLLIGFVVHHLYSAFLMAMVEKNGMFDSIFTGDKWLRTERAEQDRQAEQRFRKQGSRE
jgi:Ni/Fe-hydrogenase 1 B-type cytochrome subunit